MASLENSKRPLAAWTGRHRRVLDPVLIALELPGVHCSVDIPAEQANEVVARTMECGNRRGMELSLLRGLEQHIRPVPPVPLFFLLLLLPSLLSTSASLRSGLRN
eukprot:1341573-Amorphochlora_amoeboformis.AAC.1